MLWIDLLDIVYLIIGVLVGYLICVMVNKDIMQDECRDCEYRKFIEGVISNAEE